MFNLSVNTFRDFKLLDLYILVNRVEVRIAINCPLDI